MVYLYVAYLPVILIAIILPCMLITSVILRVSNRRERRRATDTQAAEFTEWMDTVDSTVGIAELLRKGK